MPPRVRGRAEIEKKAQRLEVLAIEYVDLSAVHPNSYNPNRQSEHDFELLIRSMQEDGFTQPIIVQRATNEIVDGYHRWKAASTLTERGVKGYNPIPVVYTDMTPEQM